MRNLALAGLGALPPGPGNEVRRCAGDLARLTTPSGDGLQSARDVPAHTERQLTLYVRLHFGRIGVDTVGQVGLKRSHRGTGDGARREVKRDGLDLLRQCCLLGWGEVAGREE